MTEQLETTGLVPGCKTTTSTAADQTKDDEPENLPVRSPSPAPILSALPPLPAAVPAPNLNNISTAPSSSDVQNVSDFSNRESLDRLLDLAAKVGFDGLVRFQSMHALKIYTDDPEERLFCLLYSKLISLPETTNSVSDRQTFDNLPLPSRWAQKKRQIIQPPKMVSSDAFRQYLTDEKKKKRK